MDFIVGDAVQIYGNSHENSSLLIKYSLLILCFINEVICNFADIVYTTQNFLGKSNLL